MNNRINDDHWLDALLEQPPELVEHGFASSVSAQLERAEKLRKQVFLGAAVFWLFLMLLVLPAQFLRDSLQRISNFSVETERFIQSLLNLDLTTFATQSGNISLSVALLLGAYALISLQVRNW